MKYISFIFVFSVVVLAVQAKSFFRKRDDGVTSGKGADSGGACANIDDFHYLRGLFEHIESFDEAKEEFDKLTQEEKDGWAAYIESELKCLRERTKDSEGETDDKDLTDKERKLDASLEAIWKAVPHIDVKDKEVKFMRECKEDYDNVDFNKDVDWWNAEKHAFGMVEKCMDNIGERAMEFLNEFVDSEEKDFNRLKDLANAVREMKTLESVMQAMLVSIFRSLDKNVLLKDNVYQILSVQGFTKFVLEKVWVGEEKENEQGGEENKKEGEGKRLMSNANASNKRGTLLRRDNDLIRRIADLLEKKYNVK